jgi:phosphopantothenoylcysteine decarboxylase/phosphopantothenate--cysteine ligase
MNINQLEQSNIRLMGPAEGIQACGETGQGRLLDVDQIVKHTISIFPSEKLAGKKVVITAGPTRESIDPVRFISNHSSGKQGYALAEAAVEAGAEVIVISGPTNLDPIDRAKTINTISADDMYAAVMSEIADCDVFIGVAAVADFKPMLQSEQKLKKTQDSNTMTIELIENPDIIASVAALPEPPFCVGFAAETEHLLDHARIKLERKKLDLIVANNVADSSIGFNSDDNRTTLVWNDGEFDLPVMSKRNIAAKIVDHVSEQLDKQKV